MSTLEIPPHMRIARDAVVRYVESDPHLVGQGGPEPIGIFDSMKVMDLDQLAAAREWQERRAQVNNEIALQEAGIGVPPEQRESIGHGKPRFAWRDAWPVVATWVAVITTAACLYILARALVKP